MARTLAGIVLLFATSGVAFAQAGGDAAGDPKIADKPAEKPHVNATVSGLDQTTAPKVQEALKSIKYKDSEGTSLPVIAKVETSIEKNAVHITLAHGASLKLSEIEKALEPTKVKIDRNSLGFETGCVLKVTAKDASDNSSLREAIDKADLFDNFEVKSTKDATTFEVNVVKSSAKTTHNSVSKALTGTGDYQLAEVTWSCPAKKSETAEKAP